VKASMPLLAGFVLIMTLAGGEALAQHDDHDHHGHSHGVSDAAREKMDPAACSLHGGQVTMTRAHWFETVFTPQGLELYFYDEEQIPSFVYWAKGTVEFTFAQGEPRTVEFEKVDPEEGDVVWFCPMHAQSTQREPGICKACGGMKLLAQDRLIARTDLSGVKPGTMKATMKLERMRRPELRTVFTEQFQGFRTRPAKKDAAGSKTKS